LGIVAIPLLILGSGTFAVEALDIAETAGGFQPLGFVNSLDRPPAGASHAGLPLFWIDDIPFKPDDCELVAGIVSTQRRGFIETMAGRGFRFVSVIHPSAVVSRRSRVGAGCILNAGVVVSPNTVIEDHVILNRGSLVGHDNRIMKYCTLGPGANLAGGVEVGTGTFIGVGAVIRDHLHIGTGAVVGAGAVVTRPVGANVMVAGLSARVARTGVTGL
jgi:sugar O-acyltransferase (sialic acid O-acetyltransferase NeuD family)